MAINISISNAKQTDCNDIIKKFLETGINCRVIETTSVVDKNIEKGCLITIGHSYYEKPKIKDIWNIIKKDYDCSHLKIDGLFDGCIYDYINADFCSGK